MIATEVLILDLLLTTTWMLKLVNERIFQVPQAVLNSLVALVLSFILKLVAPLVPPLNQEVLKVTDLVNNFPELVLNYFLGFLLFATALHVDVREFRRIRATVLALSVLSTLLSALLVGLLTYAVLHSVYPVGFREALLFGAIISPTDPVAVISILKKFRNLVPDTTRYAILGESLFNDAISVILYVALIGSGKASAWCLHCSAWMRVLRVLLVQALGGMFIGLALGQLACHVIALVEDALLEVTTSVVLVLNLEVICSYLDTSVPLAAVCAGIVMSSRGRGVAFTRRGEKRLMHIWKFMDETLNGILFLLIGLAAVVWNPIPSWHSTFVVASATIFITMLARAVSVALSLAAVAAWDRYFHTHSRRRYRAHHHFDSIAIIIWSGLRGGVSIALALAAPGALRAAGQEQTNEFGQLLFMLTYVGVVWSILVQGLFFGRVVRLVYGATETVPTRPAGANPSALSGRDTDRLENHPWEIPDGSHAAHVADDELDGATGLAQLTKSAQEDPETPIPNEQNDMIARRALGESLERTTFPRYVSSKENAATHDYQTFVVGVREL
ncbi:hypothetical protein CCYA_CCYA17G4339 [Cyanidiococcus yangmingshanensis]|nr:hypothetical protein CCYA_CCYA17G4339 [Cyanidiococcus yangmingshanensis]